MTREEWLNPRQTGTSKCSTREEWLLKAISLLEWYFDEIDRPIPKVSISLPWPDVTSKKRLTLGGMCTSYYTQNVGAIAELISTEIFIAPDIVEGLQVLEILVHELVHAALGICIGVGAQHEEPFQTIAAQLGLEGDMTATHANLTLLLRLLNISNTLGIYPGEMT